MRINIWIESAVEPYVVGWNVCEGELVVIPGYEDFQFYLTKAVEPWDEGMFRITEARTGYYVGIAGVDKQQAITAAIMSLEKHGKQEIKDRIDNLVALHGEAPCLSPIQ